MNKLGPIVIIEDDMEDHFIYEMVFKDLGYTNEVVFFTEGEQAVDFLRQPDVFPFLVISDINMPKMNGFDLRELIQKDDILVEKCIPYIFFTTSSARHTVLEAYRRCVQGFFVKPATISSMKATLDAVIRYWQLSYSPFRIH